jgi:hypothetical protein
MEKKKKGKLFDAFAIFVAFVSLGLNLLLLYNIYITPEKTPDTPEPTKTSYSKKELGEYFKNYQSKNNLADPNNIVYWDVYQITYRGFFKTSGKKLYYITERFSCVSGDSCVTATGIQTDKTYDYNATFVVAIDSTDPYDLKFEILDYSIENSIDFIQDETYDLE